MAGRADYGNCLTNLACSVRRFFGLPYAHKTLDDIDEILDEENPESVVVILCDGMGTAMLDRFLPPEAFLRRHLLRPITSVFPATTVAATTSVTTGLNPCETGMLGWNMYYKGLDAEVAVFRDCLQSDSEETYSPEVAAYTERHMRIPLVTDEVDMLEGCSGRYLSPFGKGEPYETLDQMFDNIEHLCSRPGKKYVYAYYAEPDHTMHEMGSRSPEAAEIVRDIDRRVEGLVGRLRDAVVIVVADHGHHDVENIRIGDFPDVAECLSRDVTLEPRAPMFFVKPGREAEFEAAFRKHLGDDFELMPCDEVISSELFGDGEENPIFRESLGDYLAVATGNKALLNEYGRELASHHAGGTADEILVPLIVAVAKAKE